MYTYIYIHIRYALWNIACAMEYPWTMSYENICLCIYIYMYIYMNIYV